MQRFRGTLVVGISCAALVVAAASFSLAPTAYAFDLNAFRNRIEDRLSRIDNLRGQENEEHTDTSAESEPEAADESTEEQENEETVACECSARLDFSHSDIRWQGGILQFIPRFDVKIRVNQEDNAPPWKLNLNYSGTAHNTPYFGQKDFSGQCFDGRYEYTGLAGEAVTIHDIVRSLFTSDTEQELLVRLKADFSGCDDDEEYEQVEVEIEEFGNLDVGRWRRAR